ncbi:MAG: hypothetical protein HY934_09400 [Candidatus Firestonebacteria bacterium]|nr:hypothetical protein [Candidatus Firestonebacteria bacterium]
MNHNLLIFFIMLFCFFISNKLMAENSDESWDNNKYVINNINEKDK